MLPECCVVCYVYMCMLVLRRWSLAKGVSKNMISPLQPHTTPHISATVLGSQSSTACIVALFQKEYLVLSVKPSENRGSPAIMPEVLMLVVHIQCLYLEGNRLSQLPPSLFSSCPHLQWLDLSFSKVCCSHTFSFLTPLSYRGKLT